MNSRNWRNVPRICGTCGAYTQCSTVCVRRAAKYYGLRPGRYRRACVRYSREWPGLNSPPEGGGK